MIPEGVRITSSVDVGMGSRDGDVNSFVSASFTSDVDSLTLGASSSVGESGHKVGLESVYSGSGDNTSVLGSIHALTAASIMQLTDRRTDRLSVAPLVLGGLVVGRVAIPHVVRWSRTIVNAYLLAEQVREQAEEAAKKVADESSSAATGGPKGQLPDGEDPEEEDDKLTGEYRKVKGHHVHSKKAFEDNITYDPKKGFSISEEFMASRDIKHSKITGIQQTKFRELASSGRPNTMEEHTRIAVESLNEVGIPLPEARNLVAESLSGLRSMGVKQPTILPWSK